MTLFQGKITGLSGYTVRPEGEGLIAIEYEFQITTDNGVLLLLLTDAFYEAFKAGTRKPGDFHFYQRAVLGTRVRGAYEHWEERDLDLVRSIQLT